MLKNKDLTREQIESSLKYKFTINIKLDKIIKSIKKLWKWKSVKEY